MHRFRNFSAFCLSFILLSTLVRNKITVRSNPLTSTNIAINIDKNSAIDQILDLKLNQEDKAKILLHGCWCSDLVNDNGSKTSMIRRGAPVDDLDLICKKWITDRRCNDQLIGGKCYQVTSEDSNTDTNFYELKNLNGQYSCQTISDVLLEKLFTPCELSTCEIDNYWSEKISNFLLDNFNFIPDSTFPCKRLAWQPDDYKTYCSIGSCDSNDNVNVAINSLKPLYQPVSSFQSNTYASNKEGCFHQNILGGNWALVRRKKGGDNLMHPATDNLEGIDIYGTFINDPTADSTFSRKFNDSGFNQFLFATGDGQHWLVADKTAVYDTYSNGLRTILASSFSECKSYQAKWYNRGASQPEDPWISIKDHWDDDRGTQIYGESSHNPVAKHARLSKNHGGINVFIRVDDSSCLDGKF